MAVIVDWSGAEVKAFRAAARMSMVELAERLGISERAVAKWEAGGASLRPRPANQAALDTLLDEADPAVHARLVGLLELGDEPSFPRLREPERDPVLSDRYVKHPRDGKLMAPVPGGIYLAGESGDEPRHEDDFWIDAHPVTNADYARFVADTEWEPPRHWPRGVCPVDLYKHPVVYVRWVDASAYATWAEKSLPSSSQWEKAARGVTGYSWPWGAEMTPAKCNVKETSIGSTSSVTRFQSGISPFYAFDMIGNVWEWTATNSEKGRYELKGGSWTSPMFTAEPSRFNDADMTMMDNDTGFRCVSRMPPCGRPERRSP